MPLRHPALVEGAAVQAIDEIVADALDQFGGGRFWPAHPLDDGIEDGHSSIYVTSRQRRRLDYGSSAQPPSSPGLSLSKGACPAQGEGQVEVFFLIQALGVPLRTSSCYRLPRRLYRVVRLVLC